MKWTSVKDGLPSENIIIFVCGRYPSNLCTLALYKKGIFRDKCDNVTLENVSHWIELPRFPDEYYKEIS